MKILYCVALCGTLCFLLVVQFYAREKIEQKMLKRKIFDKLIYKSF